MAATRSPPTRGTTGGKLPRASHDEGRGRAPAPGERAQPVDERLGDCEVTRSFPSSGFIVHEIRSPEQVMANERTYKRKTWQSPWRFRRHLRSRREPEKGSGTR
jgi:hypothetical protein